MKTNKIEHTKKELIEALTLSLGVVTSACKKVGISRTTFYQYLKDDKEFAKEVTSIEDIAIDFAESQLHKQIQDGNTTATIFYLKTKGKKRGYIEKTETDITTKGESINKQTDLSNLTDKELLTLKELNKKISDNSK